MENRKLSSSSFKRPGLIKVVGFLLFFGLIGRLGWLYTGKASGLKFLKTKRVSLKAKKYIRVHVSGEISEPGLYKLKEGSTIAGVIKKAGGLTSRADLSGIDLSLEVYAGQKIIIPAKKGLLSRLGIGKSPEQEYLKPEVKINKSPL